MANGFTLIFSSLLAISAAIGASQTQLPPLVAQTFKEGTQGWTGIGPTAKLTVSHDSAIAMADAGALKLDYNITKGEFNLMLLQTPLDSLTKAKSLKFRLRSDDDAKIVIALQEQDGGRYSAMIQVPKDTWQTVELSTSDFILSQDANDPKDPDGKLDMDRVTGIVIADIAQFLVSIDNPAFTSMFPVKQGAHSLYLDSFTINTEAVPAGYSSLGQNVMLETLAHPQFSWITLGGVKLSKESGKPLDAPALRADYHQSPGKIAIMSRPLQSWILTGTKMLTLDVASTQPARLIVQLEQYDGGKYNMTIDVPGGSSAQHKKLLLDGFARADDSADKDTKLHLALVKSIAILDVSGMLDQADHDNTLWVGKIIATSVGN